MEYGYEPVSLNQIAERAGVTKASIYYYFSNKAQLFTDAVTAMMARICTYTKLILDREGPLRARLEQMAVVKMATTHVEFETMMREAMPALSETQRAAIRRAEHGIHEVLADGFVQAAEDGEIASTADPMLLAHAFSALLLLGNRESDLRETLSGEALPKMIVDLFWRGIGPGRPD
ncbi:TetR/AcrR family transcriptional regulator [Cohnella nanjingensis]|nr:TetR/AcrR family transcriptional regulator [Cohnella nanjingensis]